MIVKDFPRHIRNLEELNKEQINYLLKMIVFQKKACIYLILLFPVIFLVFFFLVLFDASNTLMIVSYVILTLIISPLSLKFVYPVKKMQSDMLLKGNLTIKPFKEGRYFIKVAIILLIGTMFLWYVIKTEHYLYVFLVAFLMFEITSTTGYFSLRKKEEMLIRLKYEAD